MSAETVYDKIKREITTVLDKHRLTSVEEICLLDELGKERCEEQGYKRIPEIHWKWQELEAGR